MPFTPFHFGPGFLIKVLLQRHFSFLVFVLTQVLIDLETLFFMWAGQYPLHRILHTYIGCNLIVIIGAVVGKFVFNLIRLKISWLTAFISSTIGSYSHVFLDSGVSP